VWPPEPGPGGADTHAIVNGCPGRAGRGGGRIQPEARGEAVAEEGAALAVLDDSSVAYYPGAFSPGSLRVLQRLFPDAVLETIEPDTCRWAMLEALEHDGPVVLLIDEVDRADDEFEAFLLEFLSDFAVTIPELGTLTARERPVVVLTSNRTRELHDALKRRCLYHWIDYPTPEREREIVRTRIPGAPEAIAARVVAAVGRLREQGDLYKLPGVGETLVWTRALLALGEDADLDETLGAALKVHEDVMRVRQRGVLEGV